MRDQLAAPVAHLSAGEHSGGRPRLTGGVSGSMALVGSSRRPLAIGGSALRAAVLGANDGLLSNFSLVMGVAGAGSGSGPVLIAGLAGLMAGSLSMALGEWLSVQSARELYEHRIADRPASGAGPDVDVDEMGGSAWTAALTSFILFALGAMVPVAPFLFGSGGLAIGILAGLSALALFAFGAAITPLTGRNPILAGLRQVGFGLAAAAITFGIGTVLGQTLI
jgi:VIT1/CCC1 family predicted Fe2+/Mn2+ transporter